MLRFIKNWTMPLAMLAGTLGYFLLARIPLFSSVKYPILNIISTLVPILIFAQLLLSFCKIDPKQLLPRGWQWLFLLFQSLACCAIAVVLLVTHDTGWRAILEGMMVCLVCPTATAGVVITGKLGGNTSTLVTYTLLSNIMAAILVPLVFPIVEPHEGLTFLASFSKIISKVFPLLLMPFFLAIFFRFCMPRVHRFLLRYSSIAFYLWACSLTIVVGQTVQSLVNSSANPLIECGIALGGLLACVLQFWFGKKIGKRYNDQISAGQALGQKNTILAIWMATTYLNPLAAVGPGSYVIWQNSFNSWQLWRKRKSEEEAQIAQD